MATEDESLVGMSTTVGSNTPAGTDAVGADLDNHLRAIKKNLAFAGRWVMDATVSAASTTLIDTDLRRVKQFKTDAGDVSCTLATAAAAGNGYVVNLRKTVAANLVVIHGFASETIDGGASLTLSGSAQAVTLVCDGSNWVTQAESNKAKAATELTTATESVTFTHTVTGFFGGIEEQTPLWNIGMPPGTISAYAVATAPTGWLLCDGTAYNGTTSPQYARLHRVIGNVFGGADITNFQVPDLTGRTVYGLESSETRITTAESGVDGGSLGDAGGAESHQLTVAESATHNHGIVTGAVSEGGGSSFHTPGSASRAIVSESIGGDGTHTNLSPGMMLSWIIKY